MVITSPRIQIGSRVRVQDQDGQAVYTIVGPEDSDGAEGRISEGCPLGRALLGHRPGDRVAVRAPGGVRPVTILDVG